MGSQADDINWYHGKLSRDDAEQILLNEEFKEDGTFLVRQSNTSAGDYGLSVMFQGEVVHYQIRRHGEDAFFSLDEQIITHGLETLIEYYTEEEGRGLICSLTRPVKKDPPPNDTRRHGRTNLLHRATKAGNYTVVTELLKYRYVSIESLEAKNQDGQTVVHLASQHGHDDVLQKFLDSGANVNCRDTEGYTPLHYACQKNLPSTARILITKGGANVQLRNTKTGWVPLHEAASRGHIDVIVKLLGMNTPVRPRTNDNETPAELAHKNGHVEVERLLRDYKSGPSKSIKKEWYHGTLDRNEANTILKEKGNNDGSFLVRYSDRSGYVVSMIYADTPYHFVIQNQGDYYFIDYGPYLDSLEHVIDHYTAIPDGLPTTLQIPVAPLPKPPLPDMPRSFSNEFSSSTLPFKNKKHVPQNISTATLPSPHRQKTEKKTSLSSFVDLGIPEVPPVLSDLEENIPNDNVILKEIIGEGEFGSVYRGILQDKNGSETDVAVKTLRQECISTNRQEFLREAKVMMGLRHHCIVKLINISKGDTLLMVQELVPLGSMLSYIQKHADKISPNYELKLWASQIALGMQYLEEKRFVHRDLAARNILLASKHQAKISDFGLSRAVNPERDYYKATHGGRWPIKWYAPESFNYGTFSSASDVWSFGVTLWEMFSYGQQPFGDMKGVDVIDFVGSGGRLSCPPDCPTEIFEAMKKCWLFEPKKRPPFSELVNVFSPNYTNVKVLLHHTHIS